MIPFRGYNNNAQTAQSKRLNFRFRVAVKSLDLISAVHLKHYVHKEHLTQLQYTADFIVL